MRSPQTPLLRAPTFGDRLADTLRERIVSGDLPRDTHLVEGFIGDEYGVSRGPVREALRQLRTEGLVEQRRQGFHVVGFTAVDVRELYSIRAALESLALNEAMGRSDAEWEKLAEAQRLLEANAGSADRTVYSLADLRFHSTIYELSGNRRLAELWRSYEPLFRTMLGATNRRNADLLAMITTHADILEAAQRGDRATALAVLEEHISDACDMMVGSLALPELKRQG